MTDVDPRSSGLVAASAGVGAVATPAAPKGSPIPVWGAMLLAGLLVTLVITGTKWGPGVTPDSMEYLHSAWSFAAGNGFRDFPAHWPPLYPMVLSGCSLLGGDILFSARVLNAALAGVNLWLLALVVGRCGWRRDVAILFLLLLALQPGFLHIHYLLWSEPFFLTLALMDLLLLEAALRAPQRRVLLCWLAVAAAAAVMVRYAGLFLVALNAGVLLAFATDRPGPGSRIRRALVVSIAALAPFLAWISYNGWRGATATNRSLAWHPPGEEHIQMFGHTIATWVHLPDAVGLPVFALMLAGACLLVWRRLRGDDEAWPMRAVFSAYLLVYSGFLLVSITLVDYLTPLGERILFPLMPIACAVLLQLLQLLPRQRLSTALLAVLFALFGWGSWIGWIDWQAARANGLGLTSKRFQSMPVLPWMQQLPTNVQVVSNGPDVISIYLHRDSVFLPRMFDPTTRIANPQWRTELDAMTWRDYLPEPAVLDRLPRTRLLYQGEDALVWYRPPAAVAGRKPSSSPETAGENKAQQ